MKPIDAHLHLWDRREVAHPWMDDTDLPAALHLDDVEGVESAVLVEAGPADDAKLGGTAWLADHASGRPEVLAAVGALPGAPGDDFWDLVDARPVIRGLRGLNLNDAVAGRHITDRMAERGLVLSVAVGWREFDAVARLARSRPALAIVLDHCGYPDPDADPAAAYRDALGRIAEIPTVFAKLSGPALPARGVEADRVRVRTIIEAFGAERCLAGSDWPVTTKGHCYPGWFDALSDCLTTTERTQIGRATATGLYGAAERTAA